MKSKLMLMALGVSACVLGVWSWHWCHLADSLSGPGPNAISRSGAPEPNRPGGGTLEPNAASGKVTESEVPSAAPVPAAVAPILDLGHDLLDRQRRVRALKNNLGSSELQALYRFLRQHHEEDDVQAGQVLKNDLMDVLCSQTDLSRELAGLLADLFHDPAQNVVVRDYAVQHLAALYERLNQASSWLQAEVQSQKAGLQALLWEATNQTDSSIAGTALLALARLAETCPELDPKRVGQTALSLAQNAGAGELARVTSFQVCARCQMSEALPLLADAAQNQPDACLRISAIGALGAMAGQDQLPLLERLAGGGDPRIKPAALLALHRTKQRLGLL